LKITFLGTGTSHGVPVIGCDCSVCQSQDPKDDRTRSSVMIEAANETDDQWRRLVIDSGPDFRRQMLREQVKRLDALLLTHGHKDHTGGLDDIRAYNYIQEQAMPVYCDQITAALLKKQYDYIFADDPYPGVPVVDLKPIEEPYFDVEGLRITPINVDHYGLPVVCFRLGDFSYITDASYIAPQEKQKAMNSKVLVVNALRKSTHPAHFSLQEALALVDELKPEQAYFTHISHKLGLHAEVQKELPSHVSLAWDGLTCEI